MDTARAGRWSVQPWNWTRGLLRSRLRQLSVSTADRAVIGAQGKALTLLVVALQARGLIKLEEFADTLGVFSVVVAEDDDLEGTILAAWAGMMKNSL